MTTPVTDLAANLTAVRERIASAARQCGRTADSVQLVAVSKRHSADVVRQAYALGLRTFGENYVQELVGKASEVGALEGIEWHMIGHLQTNKAKLIAPAIGMIHTIDSPHVAKELDKRAASLGRTIGALVEVNVAGETAKSGCKPGDLAQTLDAVRACSSLELRGLMTMAPYDDNAEAARPFFARLRELRDLHGAKDLPHLSMGMSNDLEIAIEEGSTIVRVGTAIFGSRPTR